MDKEVQEVIETLERKLLERIDGQYFNFTNHRHIGGVWDAPPIGVTERAQAALASDFTSNANLAWTNIPNLAVTLTAPNGMDCYGYVFMFISAWNSITGGYVNFAIKEGTTRIAQSQPVAMPVSTDAVMTLVAERLITGGQSKVYQGEFYKTTTEGGILNISSGVGAGNCTKILGFLRRK